MNEFSKIDHNQTTNNDSDGTSNEVMRAGVFVHPRTPKQIIVALLMLGTIIISTVPVINIFNKPQLFLGMPLFMFWCLVILAISFVVMLLAIKWEVH